MGRSQQLLSGNHGRDHGRDFGARSRNDTGVSFEASVLNSRASGFLRKSKIQTPVGRLVGTNLKSGSRLLVNRSEGDL